MDSRTPFLENELVLGLVETEYREMLFRLETERSA